jgi:lipocalin-like protein
MLEQLFVGTWRLVSAEFRSGDGQIVYPYGREPVGLLVYDAHGYMTGQIMGSERPAFPSAQGSSDSPEALKAVLKSYIAYFGTYEVDADNNTITHHVRGSLVPDWVGSDQVRFFAFAGNQLTLSTPPLEGRKATITGVLVWERAKESIQR